MRVAAVTVEPRFANRLPLDLESEEAWARPVAAGDLASDRGQRAIELVAVDESVVADQHLMGIPMPVADQPAAHLERCRLLGREGALGRLLSQPCQLADIRSLERDVFPTIGALPIRELNAPLVLAVLREIECRGAIETAKRVRQRISSVFVFAIAKGITQSDPAERFGAVLKRCERAASLRSPTSFDCER